MSVETSRTSQPGDGDSDDERPFGYRSADSAEISSPSRRHAVLEQPLPMRPSRHCGATSRPSQIDHRSKWADAHALPDTERSARQMTA